MLLIGEQITLAKEIVLTTINAKWIHPSLALRLLKANLGQLENSCEIFEFALRQPLCEKVEPLLAAAPRILGISVSIWNHTAAVELLKELEKGWTAARRPIVVLGGPEASHLPKDAEIFNYADYVICGEGENVFKTLCETLLARPLYTEQTSGDKLQKTPQFICAETVSLKDLKTAYHLYTNEDLAKKLIYVEASRGCPFRCEFCLSAVAENHSAYGDNFVNKDNFAYKVREFPIEIFFAQMDDLVKRGAKTFKFLDRTFNSNIKRAVQICEFFLEKIEQRKNSGQNIPLVIHFEMVPSLFTPKLREVLACFPPETLRIEVGFQTLNPDTAALIRLPSSNAEKGLNALRFLCEKTNAIIHADLIAGLPGEDLKSFGKGFDLLWQTLSAADYSETKHHRIEIQTGILKLLPGAPISRHSETFAMRYNQLPPYEVEETSVLSVEDLNRIKNFARFWEIIVNRGLANFPKDKPVFEKFMLISDKLRAYFGRNWGIDKALLLQYFSELL